MSLVRVEGLRVRNAGTKDTVRVDREGAGTGRPGLQSSLSSYDTPICHIQTQMLLSQQSFSRFGRIIDCDYPNTGKRDKLALEATGYENCKTHLTVNCVRLALRAATILVQCIGKIRLAL
jgi:hypothetical protein